MYKCISALTGVSHIQARFLVERSLTVGQVLTNCIEEKLGLFPSLTDTMELRGAGVCPVMQDEDGALSPNTEKNLKCLLQAIQSGEARLERGSDGHVEVVYDNKKTVSLAHVDRSKAHSVQQGKDRQEVQTKVNVCLEMIEAIKANRAPSGVVIDSAKAKPSALGDYREGQEFSRLKEVLGRGNCAGDIVVVKDNKLDAEHAMKTVMISEFSTDEVRCWVDLGDSESVPSLYLFRLEGSRVVFHMEKITHGVTLEKIIEEHMSNLWQRQQELVRPFSLCMFHGLLSVVKEMHEKNWTHRDLHSGNVMLTKDTMTMKVLDFGMARKLRQGLEFNHLGLKNDILNAIRLFCGLYIGQDFENNFVLEKEIKAGTLRKILMEMGLSQEDREELLQLIAMTYQVTSDPTQAGYGDTAPVLEHIENTLFPSKVEEVMRMAAVVLFPDFYSGRPDVDLQLGEEVADGACGAETTDELDSMEFDMDAAAAAIPSDFLDKLRIKI
ncbi:hypothetical protein BaRGS_00024388 [Batillaria attramentaria]|uniref:Protein kinase domain-containing protein n=1 Tax=Batillaria attramentaria TaxID=370345 RepID=A0ABD0KBA0_9CAEN